MHLGEPVNLRLSPALDCTGIRFSRTDLPDSPEIVACLGNLVPDDLLRRTTIRSGNATVHTIEHIMSAAHGLGVDNLLVELDAAEPPFLDGSALPYVRMIREAGIVAQDSDARVVRIPAPLAFRDGDSEISALPSETLRVTFFFSSENPFLRTQAAGFVIDPETFAAEIAPARTFCFFEEIENLRRQGLIRGGSLSSAVVIGKKSIINESLRFPDEPVRHKILDFIGDLALLGFPVAGHFLAWRAGHRVNAAFGQFLRKELAL